MSPDCQTVHPDPAAAEQLPLIGAGSSRQLYDRQNLSVPRAALGRVEAAFRLQELTDTRSWKQAWAPSPGNSLWSLRISSSSQLSHPGPRLGSGQVSWGGPAHPPHSRQPWAQGGVGSPLELDGEEEVCLGSFTNPCRGPDPARPPSGCPFDSFPSCPGPGHLRIRCQRTRSASSLGDGYGGQSQGQEQGENPDGASCCPRSPGPGLQPARHFPSR